MILITTGKRVHHLRHRNIIESKPSPGRLSVRAHAHTAKNSYENKNPQYQTTP